MVLSNLNPRLSRIGLKGLEGIKAVLQTRACKKSQPQKVDYRGQTKERRHIPTERGTYLRIPD